MALPALCYTSKSPTGRAWNTVRKRKTKIALVVPRTPFAAGRPGLTRLRREQGRFRGSVLHGPLPNLALLTLAGHTSEHFDVVYLDENAGARPETFDGEIAAITSITCQAPRAYALADHFRRRGTCVVLGGAHPTALPREARRHSDTVITGEAEGLWESFLRDYLSGSPAKTYAPAEGTHCNLRSARVPRYELLRARRFRTIPVQVGRGCPVHCEFCAVEAVHGSRYRHKKIEQVLEEVAVIKSIWKGKTFKLFFTDDNLHLNRRFAGRLLEALAPLEVEWSAIADIGIARDRTFLRALAEAGCRRLLVGFEDALPGGGGLQETVRTGRSREEYGELITKIRSSGIAVSGMFMVGRDGDRPEVFHGLRDFIRANRITDAQVAIQTPLPGTRLFARLKRQGRLLLPCDWSKFNFYHVVYRPRHMSPMQLLRGQTQLLREVYGR